MFSLCQELFNFYITSWKRLLHVWIVKVTLSYISYLISVVVYELCKKTLTPFLHWTTWTKYSIPLQRYLNSKHIKQSSFLAQVLFILFTWPIPNSGLPWASKDLFFWELSSITIFLILQKRTLRLTELS